MVDSGALTVANNTNVIFDTVLNNQSSNISYHSTTGEFTITKKGNYFVTWWVVTDGSNQFPAVYFSLKVTGNPDVISASPIVTGQVSGSAFITVSNTPSTLTLVNTSLNSIDYAALAVQANIVITEETI